jgi:hypothetical protein
MRDHPPVGHLLALARRLLRDELLPLLPPERRLDGLMVANAMAIATRRLATGDTPEAEERASLQALLGSAAEDLTELNRDLAARIRSGALGPGAADADHVHLHLLRVAADRVAETNPKALARVQKSRMT